MDVSLRHWPLFVTGLLLGAAGTMSLGLHRPTPAERAAAAAPTTAAPAPVAALPAPPPPPPPAPDPGAADEQMRAAAEAFRVQEAAAAAAAPLALALAQPQKPRVRQVLKQAETEATSATVATGSPMAIAPEPAARMHSVTAVMGGAPDIDQARAQQD